MLSYGLIKSTSMEKSQRFNFTEYEVSSFMSLWVWRLVLLSNLKETYLSKLPSHELGFTQEGSH